MCSSTNKQLLLWYYFHATIDQKQQLKWPSFFTYVCIMYPFEICFSSSPAQVFREVRIMKTLNHPNIGESTHTTFCSICIFPQWPLHWNLFLCVLQSSYLRWLRQRRHFTWLWSTLAEVSDTITSLICIAKYRFVPISFITSELYSLTKEIINLEYILHLH